MPMLNIEHLLTLADEYGKAAKFEEATVSTRVFNDGKKLGAIRSGAAGITIRRYNTAIEWFAANWPENAAWPTDVPRPRHEVAA